VIVVSDSSPLIALARIGRLNLLAELYGQILIPAEVHHEVTIAGRGLSGAEEVRRAGGSSQPSLTTTRILRWCKHAKVWALANAQQSFWPSSSL